MTRPVRKVTKSKHQDGGFIFSLGALIAGAVSAAKIAAASVATGAAIESGRQIVKKISGEGVKKPRKATKATKKGGSVFPSGTRTLPQHGFGSCKHTCSKKKC